MSWRILMLIPTLLLASGDGPLYAQKKKPKKRDFEVKGKPVDKDAEKPVERKGMWYSDLEVVPDRFTSVTIKDPLGRSHIYWYLTYLLVNNTPDDRSLDLQIWAQSDVPRGRIEKLKLGNIFSRCRFIWDSEEMAKRWRAAWEKDLRESAWWRKVKIPAFPATNREWFLEHFKRFEEGYFPDVQLHLERNWRQLHLFEGARFARHGELKKKLKSSFDFLVKRRDPETIRDQARGTEYKSWVAQRSLPARSAIFCVAIFGNVDELAANLGIMFLGLTNLVSRSSNLENPSKEEIYLQKKVRMVCVRRSGGAFRRYLNRSVVTDQRWVVLRRDKIGHVR